MMQVQPLTLVDVTTLDTLVHLVSLESAPFVVLDFLED